VLKIAEWISTPNAAKPKHTPQMLGCCEKNVFRHDFGPECSKVLSTPNTAIFKTPKKPTQRAHPKGAPQGPTLRIRPEGAPTLGPP